jgi:hypothetical protein
MEAAVFFVSGDDNHRRLAEFAKRVFNLLEVREWEERFSSNYPPDEHYFAGYSDNAEVKVCDGDDNRTPDHPFRVWVKDATWRKGSGTVLRDAQHIAKTLAAGGFNVFVPKGSWFQTDWDGDGDVYAAS